MSQRMKELEKDMYYVATPQTLKKANLLRSKMTEAETILWEKLKGKQVLGFRFRRQHPVNTYIVDFYCHSQKLVIELDGEIHRKQEEYDLQRTKDMERYGLKVIRFQNDEIKNEIEKIILSIKNIIQVENS